MVTGWLRVIGLSLPVLVGSALAGCGDDGAAGPQIDSVMPTSAPGGTDVEVLGRGFCGAAGVGVDGVDGACEGMAAAGVVHFGAAATVRASVRSWTSERITVEVPTTTAVGATLVVVTVDGIASAPVDFEVE